MRILARTQLRQQRRRPLLVNKPKSEQKEKGWSGHDGRSTPL